MMGRGTKSVQIHRADSPIHHTSLAAAAASRRGLLLSRPLAVSRGQAIGHPTSARD